MEVQTKPRTQSPPAPILWDIIEEHFNEAEFLFERWESALRSPLYNLTELGATIEKRLEAHLDGLLIGGKEVAERILIPELENSSEHVRATVAALVLLSAEEESSNRVFEAVQKAEGTLQKALIRALILSNVETLNSMVLDYFRASGSDSEKAAFLEILTGRGMDPGEYLRPCIDSKNPLLVSAALEAARRFARRDLMAAAQKHLGSDQPLVRASALKTSLAFGSTEAWVKCVQWAATANVDPDLLTLIAILGRPEDQRVLFRQLDQVAHLEGMLWTLGFCGTVEAGDVCLAHLQNKDERVVKVAADSLAWIGGLDLNQDEFEAPIVDLEEEEEKETLPPLEDDDLDTELLVDGVDDLSIPNPQAIAEWWASSRGRLSADRRYLLGQIVSPEALTHALRSGSLWRRPVVALELSLRTGGQRHVSTDVFSSRQRGQTVALSDLSLRPLPFS